MEPLPPDIEQGLVRGLSAYMKATARVELPAPLRPLRDWRHRDLMRRRDLLLGWLDDDGIRARVVEWLADGRIPLQRADRELLRLASERADGWHEKLAALGKRPEEPDDGAGELDAARAQAARAKEQIRKLKEEVRTGRERAEAAARDVQRRLDAAHEENTELKRALAEAERSLQAAGSEAKAAQKRLEQTERKARGRVDRAADRAAKAVEERRRAQREVSELKRSLAAAQRQLQTRSSARAQRDASGPPKTRAVLPVPQGRLEDAPETLEDWLKRSNVHLVVDGYNVTRAEGGFGELTLAAQRDLLYEKLAALARRLHFRATIVWDGSDPPLGTHRLTRDNVRVEYSEPARDEHHRDRADDHIIALVDRLENYPVVLVTNDSGLRARARPLKVTTAWSQQLLALLSPPAKT